MKRIKRILKFIRNLYLKYMIERTEKRLCKYVSEFMNRNVVSVGKYNEL